MAGLDWLNNFGQGLSKGSISLGPYGPTILFWFKVFMGLGFTIFGILIFYKLWMQYNIRVRILVKSGGRIVDVKQDRGKIVTDEHGKRKLQLFRLRREKSPLTCPVPEHKFKYKLGKYDYYDLSIDDNWELHPNELLEIDESENVHVKPRPQERQAWSRMEADLIKKKYAIRERWKEMLLPAMFIGTLVICFLIMFFMFKELGGGMNNLANSFAQISQSCLA